MCHVLFQVKCVLAKNIDDSANGLETVESSKPFPGTGASTTALILGRVEAVAHAVAARHLEGAVAPRAARGACAGGWVGATWPRAK